jgi:hypothetical protein
LYVCSSSSFGLCYKDFYFSLPFQVCDLHQQNVVSRGN